MKKYFIFLAATSLIIYCYYNYHNTYLSSKQPINYINYEVKKGDSLSIISERYKIKNKDSRSFQAEIKYINNMSNDTINIGDIIKIPVE
jgi:LysM repeat protein